MEPDQAISFQSISIFSTHKKLTLNLLTLAHLQAVNHASLKLKHKSSFCDGKGKEKFTKASRTVH